MSLSYMSNYNKKKKKQNPTVWTKYSKLVTPLRKLLKDDKFKASLEHTRKPCPNNPSFY